MRKVTKTVYRFAELPEKIQKNILADYRDINTDFDWYAGIYDDAKHIGKLMGIEVRDIYFSGFYSQGDGACFVGTYQYAENSVEKVREYAPNDTQLHEIAQELDALQAKHENSIYAHIYKIDHYYNHEGTIAISAEYADKKDKYSVDIDSTLVGILRDFMRWIYQNLKEEYEYITSDEAVRETIEANGFEFYINGTRYNGD